jgi:hypothetical protein
MTEYEEFIKCADTVTGPDYFISNYFQIQHPHRGKILLKLYDCQRNLLDSCIRNNQTVNLVSRQMGKTVVLAGYILWNALFKPDQRIVVGANKLAAARELLARILYGYDYCPDFLKERLTVRNKTRIEFANGSGIITQAVNANMSRGMTVSMLVLDEFSFVNNNDASGAWLSLISVLASRNSQLIVISSANRDDDFFAALWKASCQGVIACVPLSITWHDHPDRDLAWANAAAARLGAESFGTEHENRFRV